MKTVKQITLLLITLILIIFILTGCTTLTYKSEDVSLKVVDWHPGGESLMLDGVLDGIGSISVNRETEGAEDFVEELGL